MSKSRFGIIGAGGILLAAGMIFTFSGLVLIGPAFMVLGAVILLRALRKP